MGVKFADGELTELAEEKYWDFAGPNEDDELPQDVTEYIDNFENQRVFPEKIKERVKALGYDGSLEETSKVAKFIDSLCREANIPLPKDTAKRWLEKKAPNSTGRENVYMLCFALGMNANETAEFFIKAYFERPFNCKDVNEATYFFCMNTGRSYVDAQRIISELKTDPVPEDKDAHIHTVDIGDKISNLTDEKEYTEYIRSVMPAFSERNLAAFDKIDELSELCRGCIVRLANDFFEDKDLIPENESISEKNLLDIIYGREPHKCEEYDTLSNSAFPEFVRKNIPQEQQLSNIKKRKKEVTNDSIRKTLILLHFYRFFADAKANLNKEYIFDEYVEDLDSCLNECGFVQHYWRNPYDWIFGYCASQQGRELDTFRTMIAKYSNKEEE